MILSIESMHSADGFNSAGLFFTYFIITYFFGWWMLIFYITDVIEFDRNR